MSRFGWAYVSELVTGSSGTPGGSDKTIQFASGSTFSGSTNFTFDYTTNTVRLTGTLYADTLIVSSSTIYKSGSTKFGDDSTDTHQFTGSLLLSSSNIVGVGYVDFNTSSAIPSYNQGRLYYDTDTFDLAYYTPVTDVKIQIGQQTVVRVKNSSGSPINKGKLVHITGGVGDNPLINTASWDNDTNSANTLGMTMNTINHNDFGYVLLNGIITGVNTDPATFTAGQVIYLSSSGNYTATTPVAPKHTVRLGEVVRAHASVGSIFVKIDNGYEIGELHDVLLNSVANADLLVYNSGSGLWQNNKILSGSYTITGTLTAGAISAASNITSTGGILSSSTGVQTAGAITSATNVTSTGGTISASVGFQTAGTITSVNNITSTNGTISASVGLQTAGTIRANNGLIITGSSFVQALSSSGKIQAGSFTGDGLGIVDVLASNVIAAGNDWNIQYFDANTGYINGSNSLIISASSTPNLFITQFSSSGIVKSSRIRTSNTTLADGDYYLFMSGINLTATLGTSQTGREVILYNYGSSALLATGSGISGFYASNGNLVSSIVVPVSAPTNARSLKLVYLSDSNTWNVI
jgi:hypothetical protein